MCLILVRVSIYPWVNRACILEYHVCVSQQHWSLARRAHKEIIPDHKVSYHWLEKSLKFGLLCMHFLGRSYGKLSFASPSYHLRSVLRRIKFERCSEAFFWTAPCTGYQHWLARDHGPQDENKICAWKRSERPHHPRPSPPPRAPFPASEAGSDETHARHEAQICSRRRHVDLICRAGPATNPTLLASLTLDHRTSDACAPTQVLALVPAASRDGWQPTMWCWPIILRVLPF